jgi:uncharacterized protein with von Willebrand factor type A (vWA) domain
MTLVDRHVRFLAALRGSGVNVSSAEGLDAVRALLAVDLADREVLRTAYAATVVKRHAERPVFDALFDLWFPPAIGAGVGAELPDEPGPDEPSVEVTGGRGSSPEVQALRQRLADLIAAGDEPGLVQLARGAVGQFGALPSRSGSSRWSAAAVLDALTPRTLLAGLLSSANPADDLAATVAREQLSGRIARFEALVADEVRRRIAEVRGAEETARISVRPTVERLDFLSASQADLVALRREIYPLSRRLATRISMRHRRGRRGPLDFRRTIRSSLSTGGVPMSTRHKPRRPHKPELVVLCDLSSSVASFARFALLLVYALREQFTRVRAFAFVDSVEEITEHFADSDDPADALTRMAAAGRVRLGGGGTNYGRVFTEFADRYADAVGPKTALLVLGDARANYLATAADVLADLAAKARHAYWLNPEPQRNWGSGDSAAHVYAERVPMHECRNLRQLEQFIESLA